jgi:hypothetical protein
VDGALAVNGGHSAIQDRRCDAIGTSFRALKPISCAGQPAGSEGEVVDCTILLSESETDVLEFFC